MILIETGNFTTFDEYAKSLGSAAQKNFQYVKKHNADLSYELVSYDRNEVEKFMQLWEHQLIRGKPIAWAFPIGWLDHLNDKGLLKVFRAKCSNEVIAMHFIEVHGKYVECHPPMYDKKIHSKRYLAKYMWFSLIGYAIMNANNWILDFGGGEGTWPEVIRNRARWPNPKYKWAYVPQAVKDHPDEQPAYEIIKDGEHKQCVIKKR